LRQRKHLVISDQLEILRELVSTLEQGASNQKVEGAMRENLATNASRLQQGDATSKQRFTR